MYFSVVCDCAFCCEEARLKDQFLFVDWGRGGWQAGGVVWSWWWIGGCKGKGLKGEWEGVATFLSTILDSGVRNLEHKKIFNMDWKVKHVMTHYLQPSA